MRDFFGDEKYKKIIIAFGVTLIFTIIVFVIIFSVLNKKATQSIDFGLLNVTTNQIVSNDNIVYPTSISKDKGINEVINETLNNIKVENKVLSQGQIGTQLSTSAVNVEKEVVSENNTEKVEIKEDKVLEFQAPVSGEILVDFAKESLVYSETLDEWTTHLGIDIKADKTSVVSAAESGSVKSIKNDPRYGLTITISHDDEFETVYSNLLSTEFVNEGDTVEKGQTIGTIGESASFEIAEVPHLHFEMYKNGEVVNPTEYLK